MGTDKERIVATGYVSYVRPDSPRMPVPYGLMGEHNGEEEMGKNRMTKTERLIVMMLCDLYRAPRDREFESHDVALISKAVANGHLWALDWKYGELLTDFEYTRETVRETADILEMWRMVEIAFNRLSAEEQEEITSALELPSHVKLFGLRWQ